MATFSFPPLWLHLIAGAISFFLGIAYFLSASSMAQEFKLVLAAHRRILIMSIVSQGILLCFIGALIIIAHLVSPNTLLSRVLSFCCAGVLLALSVWTGSTGGRSEAVLLRFSHFATIVAAGLVLAGLAQG
jgi:hypothetical protein